MPLSIKQNDTPYETADLVDGKHYYLKCRGCLANVVDIWNTSPDAKEFKWKLQANCPWCNDKSYELDIEGVFHVGGIGVPKPGDRTNEILSTKIEKTDYENGIYKFTVIKADKDAKPIYRMPERR